MQMPVFTRRTFGLSSVDTSAALFRRTSAVSRRANDLVIPMTKKMLLTAERARALRNARRFVTEVPVTVSRAKRSPGDAHAYYSESDYWWPDPANPKGPYIRRDGQSNPNGFDDHRQALIRLSRIVPALAAKAAKAHLLAWFVNSDTRLAPHLQHAQAIIGVNTGRGTGILDTLHLAEVALAAEKLLARKSVFDAEEERALRGWFSDYLHWMRTSPNGLDEGGGSLQLAVSYMARFIADKARWPKPRDVAYWADWPVRHPSLVFGAQALGRSEYLTLWATSNADPEVPDIIRNYPIRQPLLWEA